MVPICRPSARVQSGIRFYTHDGLHFPVFPSWCLLSPWTTGGSTLWFGASKAAAQQSSRCPWTCGHSCEGPGVLTDLPGPQVLLSCSSEAVSNPPPAVDTMHSSAQTQHRGQGQAWVTQLRASHSRAAHPTGSSDREHGCDGTAPRSHVSAHASNVQGAPLRRVCSGQRANEQVMNRERVPGSHLAPGSWLHSALCGSSRRQV